jgi:hypothetical protein
MIDAAVVVKVSSWPGAVAPGPVALVARPLRAPSKRCCAQSGGPAAGAAAASSGATSATSATSEVVRLVFMSKFGKTCFDRRKIRAEEA